MESSTPSDQTSENQWLNKAYYMPLINKSSTTFGPIGQWVYINGALFDSQTTVLLDDILVEDLKIYHDGLLGFSIPKNISNGLKTITVKNSEGENTYDNFIEIGDVVGQPIVDELMYHDTDDSWVYLRGDNFAWAQTTATFNDKTVECLVYSPESCGFRIDANTDAENINLIVITTPHGSYTFTVE